MPDDPYNVVEYISIINSIEGKRNFNQKLKDEAITLKSKMVVAVIRAKGIIGKLKLIWKWYDPEKDLVFSSDPVFVNKKAKYLEYFIAWNNLKNEFFIKKEGLWTVIILVNEKLMAKREFKIGKISQ